MALKMMDRMDPTAYSFSYSERVDLYYEFLEYWLNVIETIDPDIVVFSESPHDIFSYILYAVCIENGISILRFVPTYIEGLTFLSSALHNPTPYLKKQYDHCLKESTINERYLISSRYLDKNRGTYESAMPYYMNDIINKQSLVNYVSNFLGKIRRFIKNEMHLAYKKGTVYSIKYDNITKLDFLKYRFKGELVKKSLEKKYHMLSKFVDLTCPYIYVALHYQPEKTTAPEGDVFVDQWLMISMLSIMVPKDWKIYVKEHVSQFSSKLYGEQGRSCVFYTKLSQMENVQLVKTEMSSFDLIDSSKAVATVTGTVGIESVIRSKPVLSFGYAWYELCHGVMPIKTSEDLKDAISKIENGFKVSNVKVNAFLYAIEDISLPCYVNIGNKRTVKVSEDQNISNLTDLLINYADKCKGI